MNVFAELIHSVYDFNSYKQFLKNKKSKVFGFAVLLMLFYFLITTAFPVVRFQLATGGFGKMVEEYIPDFELKDGTFWLEEPLEYEDSTTYFYIDTDPDFSLYSADEIAPLMKGYTQVILADSEKIILKNQGQVEELYFSDLDADFSKDDLLAFVPFVYLIIFLFLILAFIFKTAFFFLGVLMVALIGMIVASCMKQTFTFGQLYQMGVYARTAPLILKAVLSFLPFGIPLFFVINFGISVVYLAVAMNKMKGSDESGPVVYSMPAEPYNGRVYGNSGVESGRSDSNEFSGSGSVSNGFYSNGSVSNRLNSNESVSNGLNSSVSVSNELNSSESVSNGLNNSESVGNELNNSGFVSNELNSNGFNDSRFDSNNFNDNNYNNSSSDDSSSNSQFEENNQNYSNIDQIDDTVEQ